jgi:acyl-CoA dehydrogenase
MIDFGLTDEEELIRATAERFAHEQLRPREREHEQGGVSAEVLRGYTDLALASLDVPERLGGQGLGMFLKCVVLEELACGDAGAVLALDGLGPARYFVLELPEDKAVTLLAPFRSGPERRAALFTDWERRLSVDEHRVTGTVPWVPASRADLLVIIHGGTAYFVADGIQAQGVDAGGLRAAGSSELGLDSAPVIDVLGDVIGLHRAFARTRCYTAALLVGIARAALDYAVRYTQDRVVFGKPIAHHQGPAFLMADMRTGIETAHLAVWRAATLIDQGDAAALPAAAGAFGEAADQTLFVTQHAVQLLGGHGFITDHPVEKWMRDARTLALLWGGRDGALGEAAAAIWPQDLSGDAAAPSRGGS